MHKNILIIADIEGSSCCNSYESSTFLHPEWPEACVGLSNDVNVVVRALFDAGVETITIKDFHRTAYNLLPELIDKRATIVSGYRPGPVPGLGNPGNATAVMMLGMHAPSGAEGFLPHTLTSRISRLEVNDRLMSEVQLFAASLAPYNIQPVFFSGCPVACKYATDEIDGLTSFPIEKPSHSDTFEPDNWRNALAKAAVMSLNNTRTGTYNPKGKFNAVITMRDGKKYAEKLAKRWDLKFNDDRIYIYTDTIHELYDCLIRLCYLTPLIERLIPVGLPLFNLRGMAGLIWVKKKVKISKY